MPDHIISVDDLANLVGELRAMARNLLYSESGNHTFTPTALAMTALRRAKLKDQDWAEVRWENRAHFFSSLALAMRNALIDHARRKRAKGRGNIAYFSPDESIFHRLPIEAEECPDRVIVLEEALARLGTQDQRLAEVVQQYYFMGFTIPEMARSFQLSEKTVDRDLQRARVVLRKAVEELTRTS